MAGLCDGQGMPTFSGADKPNREMHYPNFQGQQMLLLAGRVFVGWVALVGGTHNLSLGMFEILMTSWPARGNQKSSTANT